MFGCGYQCVKICVCAATEKQTDVNSSVGYQSTKGRVWKKVLRRVLVCIDEYSRNRL